MFSFKKLSVFTLLIAFLASFSVAETYAQTKKESEQPNTHKLEGKVVNAQSGEALPDAEVHIAGKEIKAKTGKEGMFNFEKLPAGTHTIKVKEEGYKKLEEPVKLTKNTRIVIQLKPKDE